MKYDVGTTDAGFDASIDAGIDASIDAGPPDAPRPPRDAGGDVQPPEHTCGNNVIEFAELCDPPGTCPMSCDDGNMCTVDRLRGSAATCDAVCQHAPAGCTTGDHCCPDGCTYRRDQDCPAFFIDTDLGGTTYNADPDLDGDPADNELLVASVESCISVSATAWPRTLAIDVVGRNLADVVGTQVRVDYDATLVEVVAGQHGIFTDDITGLNVGFLNLPVEPGTWARRNLIEAGDFRAGRGYAFFGALYIGPQEPFVSPDHPHPPTPTELYRADSPAGVLLARLTVRLQLASDNQLVPIELSSVAPASGYSTTDGFGGLIDVRLGNDSLFGATLAVNRPCP
jgi:hypothetical protein